MIVFRLRSRMIPKGNSRPSVPFSAWLISGMAIAHATIRPSTSAQTAHRASKICRSSLASRRNSSAVGGTKPQVPAQALNLTLDLAKLDRPHDNPMPLLRPRGELGDGWLEIAVEVVQPRVEVLDLPVAGRLDVVGVLGRVMGHQEHRVGVEPVNEQPGALIE